MEKIFVEDTEIVISEKAPKETGEHVLRDNVYILESTVKRQFKSTIFKYNEHECILVSEVSRFNMQYFKIIFFNDGIAKAWNLIELPRGLDIRIRRLTDTMFVVTGSNTGKQGVMSQFSFCRIKPSTKVEEFTEYFSRLNHFSVSQENVILSYTDIDVSEDRASGTIASYNFDGKLIKTHYRYQRHKGNVTESGDKDIISKSGRKNE